MKLESDEEKLTSGIPKLKSILRTPHRLYSNDPSKIAAGTHMATPEDVRNQGRPGVISCPATAPVVKHVDFSASARLKADRDEAKAASVELEPIVSSSLYPILPNMDSCTASANAPHVPPRRVTMGAATTTSAPSGPGDFTFRMGSPIKFCPPTSPTIRTVRVSDATISSACKRKADALLDPVTELGCESSDKENTTTSTSTSSSNPHSRRRDTNDEPCDRPTKKARTTTTAASKTSTVATSSSSSSSSSANHTSRRPIASRASPTVRSLVRTHTPRSTTTAAAATTPSSTSASGAARGFFAAFGSSPVKSSVQMPGSAGRVPGLTASRLNFLARPRNRR